MSKNKQKNKQAKKKIPPKVAAVLPLPSAGNTPSPTTSPVKATKVTATKHATEQVEVRILPEVYAKVMTWVRACPVEVSGMGVIENRNGMLVVTEAYLVDQVCSGVETEMCENALADLETDHFMSKKAGSLNWWWHSHVNMGVFWSTTDHEAIEQVGNNGYVLATVFNKKAEHRTAYYQGNADSVFPSVWVDNIKPIIETVVDEAALIAELEAKVKRKSYATTTGTPSKASYAATQSWRDDYDAYNSRHNCLEHLKTEVDAKEKEDDHLVEYIQSELDSADKKSQALSDDEDAEWIAEFTLEQNPIEFGKSTVIPQHEMKDAIKLFYMSTGAEPDTLIELETYYKRIQ